MEQSIRLDVGKRAEPCGGIEIAPLRRGERDNVELSVTVTARGEPYDLSGKTASLVGTTADGKLVGPYPLDIVDAASGSARMTLPEAMCSATGTCRGYIEIRDGGRLVETTESLRSRVLACADMDAEQAAEYTPFAGELQDAIAAARASEVKGATAVTLEPGSEATARFEGNVIEIGVPKGDRGDCDFATFTVEDGTLYAHYTAESPNITFNLDESGNLEVVLRDD